MLWTCFRLSRSSRNLGVCSHWQNQLLLPWVCLTSHHISLLTTFHWGGYTTLLVLLSFFRTTFGHMTPLCKTGGNCAFWKEVDPRLRLSDTAGEAQKVSSWVTASSFKSLCVIIFTHPAAKDWENCAKRIEPAWIGFYIITCPLGSHVTNMKNGKNLALVIVSKIRLLYLGDFTSGLKILKKKFHLYKAWAFIIT